jgi:AraC-like DNA-binding protein
LVPIRESIANALTVFGWDIGSWFLAEINRFPQVRWRHAAMAGSGIMTFGDPQSYQAAIRPAQAEVLVTAKGDFHAKLTQVELPRLWMQRSRESLPRVVLIDRTPVETGTGARHAMIMARFEDLLAANPGRSLYVAEICAGIGVSERTLRVCCQEHLGMGPMRYLWLRRMHLAQRALILASPATATVTDIAMDHGFWELGRFAGQYRALFGEAPSASLRRSPDDRWTSQDRPLAVPCSETSWPTEPNPNRAV